MTFGPDAIVACPHCGALARHWTLNSGNTFGSTQWSDGKAFAPMFQQPPRFVRCQGCRGFHWLSEAKAVGEVPNDIFGGPGEIGKAKPEWAAAPSVEEPSEAEYHEALENGSIDPADELNARIMAWWRGNDPLRGKEYAGRFGAGKVGPPASPETRRRNMEAIIGMLDGAIPGGLIMKAEALRQLGRFDEALTVLRGEEEGEGELAEVVSALRRYCEASDVDLHELG